MSLTEIRELAEDTVRLTGADGPALLEPDAPVLAEKTLAGDSAEDFYLIGLIGGKDVGKSALVNAIIGDAISESSGYGPGTESAIAYVHVSRAEALRKLLETEAPGQCRIVTHRNEEVIRQALLDLPDIDSVHEGHVELTRKMLRHVIYPIWVQSVEKYADLKPRQLLARVAEGNAPENFIFCLNKSDQLYDQEGEAAARELRDDYAARIAKTLNLAAAPHVWMVSARFPDRYDFPKMRESMGRQKSQRAVVRSRSAASRRHSETLLTWIEKRGLGEKLDQLDRLVRDAEESIASEIVDPLIDEAIPALLEAPRRRMALGAEAMRLRAARWPILCFLHEWLAPMARLVRMRFGAEPLDDPQALEALAREGLRACGQSLGQLTQAVFARLRQTHPELAQYYAEQRLWEPDVAQRAARSCETMAAEAMRRQREAIRIAASGGGGPAGTWARWLLTWGAAIWFPFFQPALEAALQPNAEFSLALLAVRMASVTYIATSGLSLLGYYFAVWLLLRWLSQRMADNQIARWKAEERIDPEMSVPRRLMEWMDQLLAPLRHERDRLEALANRAKALRGKLEGE